MSARCGISLILRLARARTWLHLQRACSRMPWAGCRLQGCRRCWVSQLYHSLMASAGSHPSGPVCGGGEQPHCSGGVQTCQTTEHSLRRGGLWLVSDIEHGTEAAVVALGPIYFVAGGPPSRRLAKTSRRPACAATLRGACHAQTLVLASTRALGGSSGSSYVSRAGCANTTPTARSFASAPTLAHRQGTVKL